jgi:hypothetical protein
MGLAGPLMAPAGGCAPLPAVRHRTTRRSMSAGRIRPSAPPVAHKARAPLCADGCIPGRTAGALCGRAHDPLPLPIAQSAPFSSPPPTPTPGTRRPTGRQGADSAPCRQGGRASECSLTAADGRRAARAAVDPAQRRLHDSGQQVPCGAEPFRTRPRKTTRTAR